MVHLGDVALVDVHFGLFGDSANLDVRSLHSLRQMYHRLRNYFGRSRWYSYVTWGRWNLVLVHSETMLVSMQDRCTVCTRRTNCSEIILDAPDGTPR
jgi:hypothetical protein